VNHLCIYFHIIEIERISTQTVTMNRKKERRKGIHVGKNDKFE